MFANNVPKGYASRLKLFCRRFGNSPAFYVIANQGLLQPAPGMEGFCFSKCLLIPENGMNTIELFVVNYSDFDFSRSNVPV